MREVRSLQAWLFTILRCRIADLARARGPTAGAVPLHPSTESSTGIEPIAPGASPSGHARRGEAVDARPEILADVLEAYLEELKEERKFRDLEVLEMIFCLGTSQQDAARSVGTSEPTVSRIRASCVQALQKLVREHPRGDALDDLPRGDDVSGLVQRAWQQNGLTCLKRSTLGSYALGALSEPWAGYARFHLDAVGCEDCRAHLEDILAREEQGLSRTTRERIFTSSAGFLR